MLISKKKVLLSNPSAAAAFKIKRDSVLMKLPNIKLAVFFLPLFPSTRTRFRGMLSNGIALIRCLLSGDLYTIISRHSLFLL